LLNGSLSSSLQLNALAASVIHIVYYDDEEGGVLQTRTMLDGEEILAARRLRQFFREEAPLRA
jgi:hypothetical protein